MLDKYNETWDTIKETFSIKFHCMPVYNEKYMKANVREFDGVMTTNFLRDEVPKVVCFILSATEPYRRR